MGPPCLKTPIPPSNPRILNTHNEIWDQNEIALILDVWWFNNPGPVELRDLPRLKTPIPPSNPRILTPKGPMSVDGFLGSSSRLSQRQKHERSSEILKEGGPI
jgi:hypothetical protein